MSINSILIKKIQPIYSQYEPASELEVVEAERVIGARFPEVLRDLQLHYGRLGFAGDTRIWCDELSDQLSPFTVFGCKGDKGNLVMDYTDHPDLQARKLVPFADDLLNNRFVFDVTSEAIYFVDYCRTRAIYPLASSLSEFFDRIELIPE